MMPSPPVPAEVAMTPAAARLHQVATVLSPATDAAVDLTIFISCYNESAYIVDTLETVRAALSEVGGISYEIIVIDDCSKDRSADLVEDYIRGHPEVRILLRRNKVNRGLAQNYVDTAFIGRGKFYRLICGDNAEPKDTMVAVFREIGNAIGGFRLRYYNGLAIHLRYNVMRWHPNTRGFGFQADIICMLLDHGFTYKEVPVRTVERKGGDSRALTFRNQLSVAHTLVDLFFRRLSHIVYKRRNNSLIEPRIKG
jgi:glycosyltransferase involved in cell wall biosynthesis